MFHFISSTAIWPCLTHQNHTSRKSQFRKRDIKNNKYLFLQARKGLDWKYLERREKTMSSCYQLKTQGLFWRAIFLIPSSFSCPFAGLVAEVQEWRFEGLHSNFSISSQSRLHRTQLKGPWGQQQSCGKAERYSKWWRIQRGVGWHTQEPGKWLCQCPA